MKGRDTSFAEKLTLLVKDNAIFYVAATPDNKDPVYFKLTRLSKNSFAGENTAYDFPEKIACYHEGSTMTAIICGNGKKIIYILKKKQDDAVLCICYEHNCQLLRRAYHYGSS